MRTCFILTLYLLLLISCAGQSVEKKDIGQSAVKSKTFQSENEENIGIVYFSQDNGNTWENASSGIPQKVSIGLGGVTSLEKFLGIATKEYGVFQYNLKDNIWVNIPTAQYIIDSNIGAVIFHKNTIYVGTQYKGIFYSADNGKTWDTRNARLNDLTIRRFFEFHNDLYVCTNDGFYLLNEKTSSWDLEYGEDGLQVNGATAFRELLHIATNKGIFKKDKDSTWKNILPNHSVHNISSDSEQLYGMTYTELLLSSKDGIDWQRVQDGLPKNLYTFNVLDQNGMVFAGQWDGIYSKTAYDSTWKQSSTGLPANFAVTNLKSFHGILVITTSERKLKTGLTTAK
jgi:ligand-binding sensor domain-containing protein